MRGSGWLYHDGVLVHFGGAYFVLDMLDHHASQFLTSNTTRAGSTRAAEFTWITRENEDAALAENSVVCTTWVVSIGQSTARG